MTPYDQIEPIEKASVAELRALQLERLRWSLRHAYENVPHYRRKFADHGVQARRRLIQDQQFRPVCYRCHETRLCAHALGEILDLL